MHRIVWVYGNIFMYEHIVAHTVYAPGFGTYVSIKLYAMYLICHLWNPLKIVSKVLHALVYIMEKLLCSFGCKLLCGFCTAHGETGLLEQRPKRAKPKSRCDLNQKTCHDMP